MSDERVCVCACKVEETEANKAIVSTRRCEMWVGRGPRTDTIDFRRRVTNPVGGSTVPVVAMREGASSGEDVGSKEPISDSGLV